MEDFATKMQDIARPVFFLRGTSQRAQLPRHLFGGARILDSDGELDEVLAVEKTHV